MPCMAESPLPGNLRQLYRRWPAMEWTAVLGIMESYVGYGEMNIVGKLGAVAGMDDVRDKQEIMDQARDLGAKLARALKK